MILKKGSTGELVKKLQEALKIKADGNFGPGTETALKNWQAANGLVPDGAAGSATLVKIGVSVDVPVVQVANAGGLNISKLKGHIPDAVLAQIPDTATRFNITTNLRLAHFLAQCGHESGGFKKVNENLNYSKDGLRKLFSKYFPTNALAVAYARQPEKIANRVYSSRMGNGNEASGDGWKFRGRGYIQLTGKENYFKFDKTVNEDILASPDLVANNYPLASAAFFFNSNNLWSLCDRGATDADVIAVTKRVNGGTNGLPDRIKHFKEYYHLLT